MSIFRHEGRRRPNGKRKGIECPPICAGSTETPPRCRGHLYAKEAIIETTASYWAYWNSGLAFKASFVAPGRTNFLSTNLN